MNDRALKTVFAPEVESHLLRIFSEEPVLPSRNPTRIASDERWAVARLACQLFHDGVEAAATEVLRLLPNEAVNQRVGLALELAIATGIERTLRRFNEALAVRFDERKVLDNEAYLIVVTDVLTGEREEFGWTYGGGKAAQLWKVERLLALTERGQAA